MRHGPVLEITADGLRDYRSGLSVPWSSVQCARIANNRHRWRHSAASRTCEALAEIRSGWRVLSQGYRPKPDRVLVSAAYLRCAGARR